MDFNKIIEQGWDYSQANPAAAISAAVIVLFLLFKKPKLLLLLIFLGAAGFGVMQLFAKLSTTGLEHRKIPFME